MRTCGSAFARAQYPAMDLACCNLGDRENCRENCRAEPKQWIVKKFTAVDVESHGFVAGGEFYDQPANPCHEEQTEADDAHEGALEERAHKYPTMLLKV